MNRNWVSKKAPQTQAVQGLPTIITPLLTPIVMPALAAALALAPALAALAALASAFQARQGHE